MNERERLMAVLKGEKPDQIPWFADLYYIYFSMDKRGLLDKQYQGYEAFSDAGNNAGYLKFYTDLGAGICCYSPFLWRTEYSDDITYSETINGDIKTNTYTTPLGTITSIEQYMPSSFSWAYTKHFVETINDLRIMLYIHENSCHAENYKAFNKIDDLWGGYGIATALSPLSSSPFQKLLTRWAGVENTIILCMDYEDEFNDALRRIGRSDDEIFNIICASNAQFVEFPENLSSEVTGAIVIWGGLPGPIFTPMFSEDSFDRYLDRIIKIAKDDGRFVIGLADQVPPDGLLSRVKKVREFIA
jgi:hypothetical protein